MACYLSTRTTFSMMKSHQLRRSLSNKNHTTVLQNRNITTSSPDNEETIEGVFIFHRHGDRSPARCLVASHMQDAEASFWEKQIPPLDRSFYHGFCDKFTTSIHSSLPAFLDAKREPFGSLSYKGMNQMKDVGKQMATRYHSRRLNKETKNKTTIEEENDGQHLDILDEWNISCYSTNYLRTIMSVQCFLDGLLSKSISKTSGSTNKIDSYQDVSIENYFSSSNSNVNSYTKDEVTIEVRDRQQDTLNAFDKHPEYMEKLIRDVINTSDFQTIDAEAAPLAARLANWLPGLATVSNYGGPSGINWIHAADHFVCRSSHNIKYSRFSHFEHDSEIENTLKAMESSTLAHLSWRFRQWYQSHPLLAAVAGPPLREIAEKIRHTSNNFTNGKKPFIVFSCHDVTLLSILYGIGADFISSDEDLTELGISPCKEKQRYWPSYASTLVFELVRAKDGNEFIRILLNGEAVTVLSMMCKDENLERNQDKSHVDQTSQTLTIDEFCLIVDELEAKAKN